MNNTISIQDLINAAQQSQYSYTVSTGLSKCSFGIVNSINGKRLSFSKALCSKLKLNKTVYLLPVPEKGKLLISGETLSNKSAVASLSGGDKKISYSANLVGMLTDAFELDFSEKTSMSFTDIEFDTLNGIEVGVVTMASLETNNE